MSAENNIDKIMEKARPRIEQWLANFPTEHKQSAVIPVLTAVQDENGGWLTQDLMDTVAEYLGMPRIAVYEVASFYGMFDLQPVGRHKINICNNISCQLCGGDEIIKYIEQKLGIKVGETTLDGKFTIKHEEECLAACSGAPMMTVDGHYHENLTPEKVDAILDSLE